MASRHWHTAVVLLALLFGIGLYGAIQRPASVITQLHTPDEKHIHQVFAGNWLAQRIAVPQNSIDGIRFWLGENTTTSPDAVVTLHVRPAESDRDIRTVSGTFSQFRETAQLEHYDATYSLLSSPETIYFPFERITGSKNQAYDFVLTANTASLQAVRIRYESDEKKFPDGQSFSTQGPEQGNLGFVLYERPTVLTLLARWLFDPRHFLIWPAIGMMIFGIVWRWKRGDLYSHTYGFAWQTARWRNTSLVIAVGMVIVAMAMYWPATHLFYYHDDLPLLARVKHFQEQGTAWKILTAHDYLETDEYSQFSFYFWRPVSAAYTWLTYQAFELQTSLAYGLNLFLFALTSVGLVGIAYAYVRSRLAAVAAGVVWLAHSTKVGALYWWSESQDIVAGLFAVLAFLLYLMWRQAPKNRWLLGASLSLFAAGALSKEHVFVLPCIILAATLLESRPTIQHLRTAVRLAAPYIFVAGAVLALRTVALGDPTLPYIRRVDDTYAFTQSPTDVIQNLTAYAAWSAEHWLWPHLEGIDAALGTMLWRTRLQPPLYPGIILLASYVVALLLWHRHAKVRHILLFSGAWWVLFLAPQLLLANDWRFRWLYLPTFGLALLIGFGIARVPLPRRKSIGAIAIIAFSVYGFWQARLPQRTLFYRDQSAYIRAATQQYEMQRSKADENSTLYLVGVVPHQETSLNAYLFRLLHPYYPLHIVRQNQPPQQLELHDIVIDMRGIDAYYPEHER